MVGNVDITLHLLGPCRLERGDGADVTPRGKRSKALLALLALSPKATRSRVWLQDKLWSDRDPSHAAGSLRQEVSALRKALRAAEADILIVERDVVALRRDAMRLDIDAPGIELADEELLEGLDIGDPEFEDWLQIERSRWRARAERLADEPPRVPADPAPATPKAGARPTLGLLAASRMDAPSEAAADMILDGAASVLLGFEIVDVLDFRHRPDTSRSGSTEHGPDWLLQVGVSAGGDRLRVVLRLSAPDDGRVLWTHVETLAADVFSRPSDAALASLVNRAACVVLDRILHPRAERDARRHEAARLVLGAVYRIFHLTDPDLDAADRMLAAAWNVEPRGTHLGWRLFVASCRIGERRITRDEAFDDATRDMMGRAVEAAPYNALMLALAAHAHSYLFREYDYALTLLNRAVAADPMHAIARDLRALTLGYIGEAEVGYEEALAAQEIGGPPPYAYCIDTTCCILAALSGRHAEAVRHGRRVLARQPDYLPALRYTAACEGHLGRTEDATRTLARIRRHEPDFSIALLRDADYPVAGVLGARVIEQGLSKLAIAHQPL
jgi:tetratricopeptide (TPR) repeat protein